MENDFIDYNNEIPEGETLTKVSGMYKDWFLDYASYVILERAIPDISDGLKPVQRRILHSMKELDDGRYNKVANIVGHTMQYHPHGDASIADAIVQIGQKNLLIDVQGNWGNIFTGDRAAASRYIEARLSKFAIEVVFSPKITDWQVSYDGRKKEPINLPIKFPLLLTQGAEGIAVGLSTKVLPHNFNELISASISYLKGRNTKVYPDFLTGGIIDVQNYNDGIRGGKIRVRARISKLNKNTLIISEIPFNTTTTTIIDSILKANEKGKIKIKKIEDNTSSKVEILVHLPTGVSLDKMIDALYAFTSCEISISPMGCIIINSKPNFIGISDMLRISTDSTVSILKKELEYKLNEFKEKWHFSSLERMFIENKIYRLIENEETWEGVISSIENGLKPHISKLNREITQDDLMKLTEIRIKRISRFDINKAKEKIKELEVEISNINRNIKNLIEYAIEYFLKLKKDYGELYPRKTEIRIFDDVDAKKVVIRNLKLFVNREEGFVGTSMRKDEYVCDCSDIDDIIAFTRTGKMKVFKVDGKVFIDKNILHVAVFKKKDDRTIYNLVYRDGKKGISYIKRFPVSGITRDRLYDLTQGKNESEIIYFSANSNGEAEIISVVLRNTSKIKKTKWDLDFADLQIKGRKAKGNIVTKNNILRIELKQKGFSTLKPRKVWFDSTVLKMNIDDRGVLLGDFRGDDKLLLIEDNGLTKVTSPDLNYHFESKPLVIEKWSVNRPVTVIYYDLNKRKYYIKRCLVENLNKAYNLIPENCNLFFLTTIARPVLEIEFSVSKGKSLPNIIINAEEFISIKGIKAIGNQISTKKIKKIKVIEELEYKEQELSPLEDLNVDNLEVIEDDKKQITLDL